MYILDSENGAKENTKHRGEEERKRGREEERRRRGKNSISHDETIIIKNYLQEVFMKSSK